MEIKNEKPCLVFYKTVETTLKDIWNYVGTTPAQLMEEAAKLDLEVTGPQVWNYIGGDGNPDTRFQLEICIPVKEDTLNDPSRLKALKPFKCAVTTHKGKWDEFKNVYEKLIGEIYQSGNTLGDTCREIYINCDFENPENNITEVQIGIN